MSLDSFNARALYLELRDRFELTGARLQKLSQMSPDDLLLHLRIPGATHRLLLSAHPERSRFHLVQSRPPQAEVPNAFVMLCRKRIGGCRLLRLEMPELERRLLLTFHSEWTLVLEWTGRPTQLLLLDPEGAVRGLFPHRGRFRLGGFLEALEEPEAPVANEAPPPPWAHHLTAEQALTKLKEHSGDLTVAVTRIARGWAPLWLKRLKKECGTHLTEDLAEAAVAERLVSFWRRYLEPLDRLPHHGWSSAHTDGELDYGATVPVFESHQQAAAERWSEGSRAPGLTDRRSELLKRLQKAHQKAQRKTEKRRQDRKGAETADRDQMYGDLLLAYASNRPRGSSEFVTTDWEGRPLTVPLDPWFSATENAERFYRRAKKKRRALEILRTQIALAEEEVAYWEELLFAAESAQDQTDLDEVARAVPTSRAAQKKRRPEAPSSGPWRYRMQDFILLVGRNPLQNEQLSLRQAARDDLWFHIRSGAGSHVIIKSGGRKPSESVRLAAAWLAAFHSRSAGDSQAEVISTEARYLKKPKQGPPGKVLYRNERTLFVNPTGARPEGLAPDDEKGHPR